MTILSILLLVKGYEFSSYTIHGIQGGLNGLYRNIATLPFIDIQLTTNFACSPSYTLLNLGYWPGTLKFCFDNNVIDTEKTGSDCNVLYPATSSNNYSSWKGYAFCVQYVSYFLLNSGQCPSGYLTCSQGKMCVLGSSCPVTNISITNSPINVTGSKTVPMSDGQHFNYINSADQTPIGNLEILIGENTPCLSENEYPQQINYPAIAEFGTGCSSYGVYPASSMIDTDNAFLVLSNQSWGTGVTWLPQFKSVYAAQPVYLSFSPRLQLSNGSNCTTFDTRPLISVPNQMLYSHRITAGFSITMVVLLLMACLSVLLACCLKANMQKVIRGFLLIVAILLLPVAIITRSQKSGMSNSISVSSAESASQAPFQCFESSGAGQVIINLLSVFHNMSSINSLWIIMLIISWVIGGSGLVILCCTARKQ